MAACQLQPLDIRDVLVGGDPIHLRQCLQLKACCSEQVGYLPTAKAAVEEQRGQLSRMPRDHRSGRDAGGDAHGVL
jgi:hypothetical protein